MPSLNPDRWANCQDCKGAGQHPGRYGMKTCQKCGGVGAVPRYSMKDPEWGPGAEAA